MMQGDLTVLQHDTGSNSGAILYHDKVCVWKGGRYLGGATNNEAEYTGLIIGLEEAVRQGARSIVVRGDSQLVVLQVWVQGCRVPQSAAWKGQLCARKTRS
jgi:ribonuclease HI